MHIYINTQIHTYINTCIHIYIYTYIRTFQICRIRRQLDRNLHIRLLCSSKVVKRSNAVAKHNSSTYRRLDRNLHVRLLCSSKVLIRSKAAVVIHSTSVVNYKNSRYSLTVPARLDSPLPNEHNLYVI